MPSSLRLNENVTQNVLVIVILPYRTSQYAWNVFNIKMLLRKAKL